MKFSENSNILHELVRLTCNNSHPARLDGSQCYNYIFRHCKRLVFVAYFSALDKIHANTFKSP
nr:MAG TPA: hypothetical protein [Caudoviricetes sp.]